MSDWVPVRANDPCPACGKPDWCAWNKRGDLLKCERSSVAPAGMRLVQPKDGGALFTQNDRGRIPAPHDQAVAQTPHPNWEAEAAQCNRRVTAEQVAALAALCGVSVASLTQLGVGWADAADLRRWRASGAGWADDPPSGAYVYCERDGRGHAVGLSLRTLNGRKGAPYGAKRGLIVPTDVHQATGPVLLVEGASDVAACATLGLVAVGRPSNSAGADLVHELLADHELLVVGENDAKEKGAWPGRDGARAVAERLASLREEAVTWSLPPNSAKDVRVWLQQQVAAGLDLADADACRAAGARLLAELRRAARRIKARRAAQADLLVQLALEHFRFGRTDTDKAFAVPFGGSNIALMFSGSRDALRSALAGQFRARYGKVPNATALTDAFMILQGLANDAEPEPVHLRVAAFEDGVVVDLGDTSGRAVVVKPGAWYVTDVSPVLFRRTAATAALPMPERGGNLNELRALINVTDECWPVMLGWLVAGLLPDLPHPILLLTGQQGAGKSSAARKLVGLIDPSAAELRSQPPNDEFWALSASGSWVLFIDNVSAIPPWWSDMLCKCVTGDACVRRKLYTDGDLHVLSFRRVVGLTSIDAGALRGDLGDRLLLVDLEPIAPERRRTEAELDTAYAAARPQLFGALLDALAAVLARLPEVHLDASPRMADFARVLVALDAALGTRAFAAYTEQADRIADEVVEADVVATAVCTLLDDTNPWEGTMSDLLKQLRPEDAGREWPRSPQGLTGRLKRAATALQARGIKVSQWRVVDNKRTRMVRLEKTREDNRPHCPDRPEAAAVGLLADFEGATPADDPQVVPESRGMNRNDAEPDPRVDDMDDVDDVISISSEPGGEQAATAAIEYENGFGSSGDLPPDGREPDAVGELGYEAPAVHGLNEDERELSEERAAIMEFEGGLDRATAEAAALAELQRLGPDFGLA